jgi:hypothetical protein
LKIFENRILRRVSGPDREKVASGWRRLHNEELHDLYDRVIKSRRMRWKGHVARMGEMSSASNNLIGKSEGKRPLERPGHRWEEGVDWMRLIQDSDQWRGAVNTVINLGVTENTRNFLIS